MRQAATDMVKEGKTIYYFDDGQNDVGRAIDGNSIINKSEKL